MPAEEAQRAADFVSGGAFALDGQQERLGELVFLFAPHHVDLSRS
jgi:cell division inhibitor SepF